MNKESSPSFLLSASRQAVLLIFAAHGILIATWASYLPLLKERLSLTQGMIGSTLLGMGVGCFLSLLFAPAAISRIGSKGVTIFSTLFLSISVVLIVVAPSVLSFCLALLVTGALAGAMDMGMNAQASYIEEQYKKPLMSTFHALYSVGNLVGASLGAGALWCGFSPGFHASLVAALCIGGIFLMRTSLIDPSKEDNSHTALLTLPSKRYLPLGILAFIAFVGEGAMGDWIALFLSTIQGATGAKAAVGLAVFSFAMAAGRFTGDSIRHRFGSLFILRTGSFLASVGLALSVLQSNSTLSMIGFGLVGIGLSNVVPILFSAAGKLAGTGKAGVGISAVASLGYAGILLGPPSIGFAADAVGLSTALGGLSILLAAIGVAASYTRI